MFRPCAFQAVALALAAFWACAGPLFAENKAGDGNAGAAGDTAEFVPPKGAKAAQRVGGFATRCADDPDLYISVLAPATTVGSSAAEQPTVYWYVSKPTTDPVEIAITDLRDKANTILELSLNGVAKGGLQKLDLKEHSARLTAGGEYELVIEVVTSADAGSKNATAVCRIARPPAGRSPTPPGDLSQPDLAAFYAKRGAWFDYIAALLDAVRAAPKDKSLLARLGASLKAEKLVWKEDGNIDEPGEEAKN